MRIDGRMFDQLREIKVALDYLEYPAGSCLISFGKTRVLCAVNIENRVPQFLLGKGQGWLSAEYSLLPASTQERTNREVNCGHIGGRIHEIRRFIGRSLRPIIDLKMLGERTIWIDCDVLQADGGTRTAAVTGAFIALSRAIDKILKNRQTKTYLLLDYVAAVSVGIINGQAMLDLCYAEDNNAEVDMNLVMTGRGKLIEVQATAEKLPLGRKDFDNLIELGTKGISELIKIQKEILGTTTTKGI